MFVYVLNCHGQPLMPCQPRKARILLKAGKAKVVKMVPFTIQLRYGSYGYKQGVSLGVDAGTRHIGVSATTEKAVLFEAEVQPRTDIQELLATRRQFRRARRSRKTRYRKSRFLNRRKHDLIHRTHQEHKIARKSGGFRDATQMGIIRRCIYNQTKTQFPNVHLTYGYLTKYTRISHQLEKSHLVDARGISGNATSQTDGTWYLIKWVRRNNGQLHKATIRKGGKRQRNTAPKGLHGFRLFDCVRYQGQVCFVFGRRSSGYFDLRLLDGTRIHASADCEHLSIVQKAHRCLVERRSSVPPTAEPVGMVLRS